MKGVLIRTDVIKTIQSKQSQVTFLVSDNKVKLVYLGAVEDEISPVSAANLKSYHLTELQITGTNIHHKGIKLQESQVGTELIFKDFKVNEIADGIVLSILEKDSDNQVEVTTYFQLYNDTAVIRTWKQVNNVGSNDLGIDFVSSLSYTGILQNNSYPSNFTDDCQISIPHNAWTAEIQWQTDTLRSLGMTYYADGHHEQASSKRISITNNSSWSASEYSPNGILENTKTKKVAAWQIENNGAWHYELDDAGDGSLLSLELYGPEEYDNHCWINLKPDEIFSTVQVAFTQLSGDFETAVAELTKYRRHIRRNSVDNVDLPVIFNDYMNGLMGDPTTDSELPLIEAAAKIGCEYYVIDCGWYADGDWWDSVGEWMPSAKRFPNGIEELTDKIKGLSMIPGLWLEIEAMGINCPLASKLPDDWFFMRHGKRVIDVDRYHLDFRNPEVRQFADKVVDRLITDYQVGYIKMDYNITTGIGTDLNSDSTGSGLLEHNRAYLKWLDELFRRYPDLVIENCGSGGMRHDYAMLQRHSIQSLTDQTDYIRNGAIAAAGASIITPEQCAVWSYPLYQNSNDEEVIYNMINAMLLRIHQSGHLSKLSDEHQQLVKDGISVYKQFRKEIPLSIPIWPLGIPHIDDEVISYGLINDKHLFIAVWNNNINENHVHLDLSSYGEFTKLTSIYPRMNNDENSRAVLNNNQLNIYFKQPNMARLYCIDL